MVISFEEKDRAKIEAVGILIVEFKRSLYKAAYAFKEVWEVAKKMAKAIIESFDRFYRFLTENVIPGLEKEIKNTKSEYRNMRKVKRHKLVKWYAKANVPAMNVNRRKVYYCRNNC